jgi:hypothetical protein
MMCQIGEAARDRAGDAVRQNARNLKAAVRPGLGRHPRQRRILRIALAVAAVAAGLRAPLPSAARAEDVSAPVILQDFENSYATIEKRMADIFRAGYGGIYTPPPGRADQGNFSVGYDQYDRFDLGSPGNPTLYGTETGLKKTVSAAHTAGLNFGIDLVLNHNGYSGTGDAASRDAFAKAGGYPGMGIYYQSNNPTGPEYNTQGVNDADGDFNSAYNYGDINGRLAGLIDINHGKNYQFIRNPVNAGDSRNIPAGYVAQFGRLANTPTVANKRFYPDTSGNAGVIYVYDPKTGEQNIPIYNFNLSNPSAGTATPENVTGYLMRNTQWLAQTVGIDMFRIDAAKHIEGFALDYYDRSVYRQSLRTNLDGSQKQIFSWCETYTGDQNYLQTFVRKDIDTSNPGRIGGNRDTLDFPLFFALRDNLTGNGFQNDWRNIKDATLDLHDDGLHNGSQGVTFVSSHDDFGPYLSNVAHAYTLMLPGNSIVYYNAKEFGQNRDFPKDGRGDALGGLYGNAIPTLVDLRNRYGRGNYIERWSEKENFAFERQKSCLVMLSNRLDGGFDSRTLLTSFAPGTPLIELTGNAGSATADPNHDIPQLVVVNGDGTVNVRFLRNASPTTGNFTGNGYLVYGLATPQGNVSLTNVAQTLSGGTPTTTTNGTTRLSDISVIKNNTFQLTLNTNQVNLLGSYRDKPADGDNALLKIDDGLDLNNNGHVDFVTPGSVVYGFEEFNTTHNPGYFAADGTGQYAQQIDTTKLSEGYHYVTVRAFRHRDDGGPAVFTDFRQTIYVDRLKPVSTVASFDPKVTGVNENRQVVVKSTDQTADNVHVFLDLPAATSDASILAMLNAGTQAGQTDRDRFEYGFDNLKNGNHVLTVVSFEITGNYNVQRFAGQYTSTIYGAGIGDTDFSGGYTPHDIDLFADVYRSNNTQFNPAADVNGDGLVNDIDLYALGDRLTAVNADQPTMDEYHALLNSVPEPSGVGVLMLAAMGMLARRRRK